MKNLQCRSPKSNKLNKRISLADASHTKSKQTQRNQNENYLPPMHIKLAKNQLKPKKQNKMQKIQNSLDEKRTKRNQNKKSTLQLNNTILLNENAVKKSIKKQAVGTMKLKTRITQKTFRQTFKSEDKKTKNEWFIDFEQKQMFCQTLQKKKKKIITVKQDLPVVSNEEYLFLGDQFFLVNNLNPTKRLLNTFRQNCKKNQPDCRFITQDNKKKLRIQPLQKKTNIFSEIKKQLTLKFKNEKATKIQMWWRKFLASKNMKKNNPEYIPQENQPLNNTQSKISFNQSYQQERRSPFELDRCISSPIKDKIDNCEDSIIASFHSADKLDETTKPKKISFTKEDISKLIAPAYKLPEAQVNSDQNEAVFSSYTKFRLQQPQNLDISSDLTPQKQIQSPQQSDKQELFDPKIKQQWSPTKTVDPQSNLLKEFQQVTRVKEQIDFRTAFQKGMIKPLDTNNTKVGISTSILSIHSFLVKFFNFYIQRYQDEFISLINMPYGHSIQARLREIQGYGLPDQVEQDQEGVVFGVQEIIDDDKLQEFYQSLIKQRKVVTNFAKANLQLQKIHNKSLIDLFNQLLNDYRPYKQINGVPYPWNHSYKALTFYFVTEQNIAQLFEKVEIKILKGSSILSGLMVQNEQKIKESINLDTIQFMQNYQQKFHPLIFQYNEERELKCCHQQIKSEPFEYSNQEITRILIQISNQIFQELVLENGQCLSNIKTSFFD